MTMNMHESIRTKLALAAAGALPDDERRQVDQHARECETCHRELEVWGLYARGLHQLPQPMLPPVPTSPESISGPTTDAVAGVGSPSSSAGESEPVVLPQVEPVSERASGGR